jgi:hypothetical protein
MNELACVRAGQSLEYAGRGEDRDGLTFSLGDSIPIRHNKNPILNNQAHE